MRVEEIQDKSYIYILVNIERVVSLKVGVNEFHLALKFSSKSLLEDGCYNVPPTHLCSMSLFLGAFSIAMGI